MSCVAGKPAFFIYNAIIQDNCEMDMVNNYVLCLATVSIKHMATDLIKADATFSMATSDADLQPSYRMIIYY